MSLRERKGRAWKLLRRRNPPKGPGHAEIARAVKSFLDGDGLIQQQPPEVQPPRRGCGEDQDSAFESLQSWKNPCASH